MVSETKIAVITGASQGIGAATAKEIAKNGYKVILLARNQALLKEVEDHIVKEGGIAFAYQVDLSQASQVKKVVDQILTQVGSPDILINNAGAGALKYIEETNPEEVVQMMELPYFAAFYTTLYLLPHMLTKKEAHIIFINTPACELAWPGSCGYIAARHALFGLAKALALDLKGSQVNVSTIISGKVSSNYFKNNPHSEERIPKINKIFPVLTPEDVAKAVVKCIKTKKTLLIIPFLQKVVWKINKIFPGLNEWFVMRGAKRKKIDL